MSDWKIGDLVVLKSGGPTMTVTNPSNTHGQVSCVYFSNSELKSVSVPAEALESA